jgi:hypothetical protein
METSWRRGVPEVSADDRRSPGYGPRCAVNEGDRFMPHRSRLATLVIDSEASRRESAVRFWASALGRVRRADDDVGARYAHLETPAGPTLDIVLQATTAEHVGVHFDIETDDVAAEVARLERLGALCVRFVDDWWVMKAPSGQVFCVIPVQSRAWPEGALEWPDPA